MERQVNNSADDVANFPRITQSETSLAYFKNRILYGYNDRNIANNRSGFSFSSDLGKSWTDGGAIPSNPGGTNGGDPVIAVDKNGIFYYGQLGTEVIAGNVEGVISVATAIINPNNTITINLPQVVGRGQNPTPVSGDQDKEWIAVGPDRGSPGDEALYVAWRDLTNNNGIRFSKYRTGLNLTQLIPSKTIVTGGPTNNNSGAFIVVDSVGDIYVFYERREDSRVINTPNRSIRMTKSTDGGNTFPIDVPVSPPFAAAATDTTICGRPSIGVDNSRRIRMNEFPQASIGPDGTIYVVWNAGTIVGGTPFINVYLAYSQDQGKSWNQVNITNNSPFHFFPSVAANCEGAHIQYNRFNDPNGVGGVGDGTFGIFMRTFSLSNGVSKELMVSNQFSPVPITHPNPEPVGADCYMGDYNQLILGPGNCLLHSWGDNRNLLNGRINPNVFFKLTSPKKKN
ncbi:sialidase family protein [Priestia megaterium]|uniref:sialidase family protein n=1 Tax=Priestia megaterium TaxID=1404 RepID=UPI002E1F4DF8|nr:sialidase family protein [Priestia megaterium]